MSFTIHHGDCREVMATLDAESVDAIVSDPPYGLSFMGKGWDHGVPGVEFWTDAMRVAKPGAHLLAFGGTRTYHRLACAIEDAGWEIRDCVMWVYGSGFPKSLNVSKAIDKARTEDQEPVRAVCRVVRAAMDAVGLKSRELTQHFGNCHPRLIDHWAARDTDSQPALPIWEQWKTLRDLLGIGGGLDAEVWRLNGRKGKPGDAWQAAEVIGVEVLPDTSVVRAGFVGMTAPGGVTPTRAVQLKAPATDAARQWQGWGTALKPAWEPIIVARKPLVGTVAENVLRHGTGGINVDGCRVAVAVNDHTHGCGLGKSSDGSSCVYGNWGTQRSPREKQRNQQLGRWPANLIHDGSEEVVGLFPQTKTGVCPADGVGGYEGGLRRRDQRPAINGGDSGSAARFFYCAKASKADRDEGCEGISERLTMRYGEKAQGPLPQQTPRKPVPQRNHHPTVKPTALMRYLCRLVTPPGGIVLDPFAGSGSTGKGAILEGFRFIGIEREAEYVEIAKARIGAVAPEPALF